MTLYNCPYCGSYELKVCSEFSDDCELVVHQYLECMHCYGMFDMKESDIAKGKAEDIDPLGQELAKVRRDYDDIPF